MRRYPDDTRPAPPTFFADAMLGSLARWMRTLGYDVEYENSIDDKVLVERAVKEGRVILTRDRLLMERRLARGRSHFMTGQTVAEQLREVACLWPPPEGRFLTRCIRCNTVLEGVAKEAVEHLVPPYVYSTVERFTKCPECSRVYWAGSHRENMAGEVERMLKDG